MTELPKKSKCRLHDKAKAGEILSDRENQKLCFCKQLNSYRCPDNECPYHQD